MAYICVDRGTGRCPCDLMEAGQCYTCSMIRDGKCDCPAGWQGVCPYSEYKNRGRRPVRREEIRTFTVTDRKNFSASLTAVTLSAPLAYALKCNALGAFVMVMADNWLVPLSVMGTSADFSGGEGAVTVAVHAEGPKTISLLKGCSVGSHWQVKGPFFNGIVNSEKYNPEALSVIVAKGMALMPLLNYKSVLGGSLANFYVDGHKLPQSFVEEHLNEFEWEGVNLQASWKEVAGKVQQDYNYCLKGTGTPPNVFFMVSPYFEKLLLENISVDRDRILTPNHSNMCCGEGLCGACSHTDSCGTTVRGCKCNGHASCRY